ncbi:hypothetical protein BX600DRAFT_475536 [Xylariales sp. PMI_506]|nr:hypothetical protein BX600DRAFT_475536 [Xylariales sp. PMI_506]
MRLQREVGAFAALADDHEQQDDHHSRQTLITPFSLLPNLQLLYVGFARRWPEVVLVEGRFNDILVEVDVVLQCNSYDDDDDDGDIDMDWASGTSGPAQSPRVRSPVALHPGLEVAIIETVESSRAYVEAMTRMGIWVIWVVVMDEGLVRRREFIDGFNL